MSKTGVIFAAFRKLYGQYMKKPSGAEIDKWIPKGIGFYWLNRK